MPFYAIHIPLVIEMLSGPLPMLLCVFFAVLEGIKIQFMKTLMIIICALGLTLSASAQRVVHAAPRVVHVAPRPRVAVGFGFGAYPFYPWSMYNPYYAYPPGYGYGYYHRPSRLDLQIQDIQNDYKDRIWSARHDESLTRHERKVKVHELKHDRDDAILQAKKDYYKR